MYIFQIYNNSIYFPIVLEDNIGKHCSIISSAILSCTYCQLSHPLHSSPAHCHLFIYLLLITGIYVAPDNLCSTLHAVHSHTSLPERSLKTPYYTCIYTIHAHTHILRPVCTGAK